MSNKLLDYEVLSIIGSGSFGTCFKVRNKLTRKLFVWKAIDYAKMDEEKRQLLVSEINLLKQLTHPNIVQYFNHIINVDTKTLYIIMECCSGGDLAQLIRKCTKTDCHFEEHFIWRCLYQLSKAIQGCHSHRSSLIILHRDIKPANVFLDTDGNIKLGDFGLARVLQGDDIFAETVVGTPYYMSPEIIKGKRYNRKSDIWSLGCLVYELCALRPPFTGKHMEMLTENISNGRFNRIPSVFSCDLQKIISFLLSVDHGYRPTIEVILHHPTVVSNVVGSDKATFPKLVPNNNKSSWFSPSTNMSSTKIDDIFEKDTTSDLRKELFASTIKQQSGPHSEPEQNYREDDREKYENLKIAAASDGIPVNTKKRQSHRYNDPNEITQEIFNEALKQRLAAIRNRESILKKQESEIRHRERMIAKKERQLNQVKPKTRSKSLRHRPPVVYDASILSVEPNDTTTVVVPTVAKFDPTTIRRPVGFERPKVTFQNPNVEKSKFNKENILPTIGGCGDSSRPLSQFYSKEDLENAVSKSLGSKEKTAAKPDTTSSKRKTIFTNLFNIIQGKKHPEKRSEEQQKTMNLAETIPPSIISGSSSNVPTKWTEENKRTAFEMLAIMNKAKTNNEENSNNVTIVDDLRMNNKILRHDRKRQSMFILKNDNFV